MAQILIIEDNAANMRLAELLLNSAGYGVLCASDAETGLKMARERQPDLILMDIQLPKMDGLTATSLLKNDAQTAAIPVVALTAMAMKEDEEKIRRAGCNATSSSPCAIRSFTGSSTPCWKTVLLNGQSTEHSS
ncbi:hypothetical protein PSA5_10050 [Pseudomonas syringae pv. actinidiae]|nr:hypothetical protein PSA5_10050 [Pseudomonas syringae pv. actinidiae]